MTMRNLLLGAAAAAALLSPLAATSASARSYNDRVRHEVRECQRELRRADSRWEYERERRECAREIAQARREAWRDRHDRYDRYDRYGRYDRYDRDHRRYGYGYRW
jgi:hypothetical protein